MIEISETTGYIYGVLAGIGAVAVVSWIINFILKFTKKEKAE